MRWLASFRKPALLIVDQQSLAPERLQQSFDLSILERDDLLLSLMGETADAGEQDVPRPEQAGHGYSRKSAGFRGRQMKSSD